MIIYPSQQKKFDVVIVGKYFTVKFSDFMKERLVNVFLKISVEQLIHFASF